MKERAVKIAFISFLLGMLLVGLYVRADVNGPSEYQVKAAFLFNFTKFVKWPDTAFAATNSPLVIGVMGDNPFGNNLELAVNGKSLDGHPLAVRLVGSLAEARMCHVLFICQKPKRNIADTIAALKNAPVLTVSETEHFIEDGGIIKFVMEDNKVRFIINDPAAKKAGLVISSKLLNVALPMNKPGPK